MKLIRSSECCLLSNPSCSHHQCQRGSNYQKARYSRESTESVQTSRGTWNRKVSTTAVLWHNLLSGTALLTFKRNEISIENSLQISIQENWIFAPHHQYVAFWVESIPPSYSTNPKVWFFYAFALNRVWWKYSFFTQLFLSAANFKCRWLLSCFFNLIWFHAGYRQWGTVLPSWE